MPYRQNKRTGEWWVTDENGNPIRPVNGNPPAPQGRVLTLPVDPLRKKEDARQDEELALRQRSDSRAAQEAERKANQEAERLEIDRQKLAMEQQKSNAPNLERQKAIAEAQNNLSNIALLESSVAGLRGQYDRNFKGKGVGSLAEYAPAWARPANGVFNDTAMSFLADLSKAKGLSAQQFNTPAEQRMLFEPLIPKASDTDEQIENKLTNLERMIASGKANAQNQLRTLGGESPQQFAARGSLSNAITGNTRTRTEDSPELAAWVSNAIDQGVPLEQINQRLATDPSGNWGLITPDTYNQARKAGRGNYDLRIQRQVPLTRFEEFSGSQLGSALTGVGNAGSFGGVKALAPDQYNAMEAMNPGSMLAGEVLGSIAGTSALGKLGSATVGRLAPKLATGGGRYGNLARGVATDATYGGLYNGVTGEGAGTGAVSGAVGSLAGRGVGKLAGGFLGGLTRAPGASELVERGVPLTVGQNAGGMAKRFEDRLASVPVVGDMVNARRIEGFQGFQRAMQNEAGAPIGAKFDGGDWRDGLPDEFGQAYDNATAGVSVPLDDQFGREFADVLAQSDRLPPDLGGRFSLAMRNRVQPVVESGQLTGDGYQQAMRGLKSYKAETPKAGFEQDYRGALSQAQDVLRSQMMRGGGSQVVEGLGRADEAYRLAKVVQDAQIRASNGTRTGAVGLPAPSQFNTAATASARKFKTARPFGKMLDAAQEVMPSEIPDSGTAGRLAQIALPGVAVAGGAGTGYVAGEDPVTGGATSLGLLALLAAGGTKRGQKAANALFFKRPDALKRVGALVSKQQGLFGAASLPLVLEAGN